MKVPVSDKLVYRARWLTTIEIIDVVVGIELASLFSEYMRRKTQLVALTFINNGIGHAETKLLAAGLAANKCIRTFVLASNFVGDAACTDLSFALYENTTLREMTISNNCISDDGARAMATVIPKTMSLEILDMAKNYISAYGAYLLYDSQKSAPSLGLVSVEPSMLSGYGDYHHVNFYTESSCRTFVWENMFGSSVTDYARVLNQYHELPLRIELTCAKFTHNPAFNSCIRAISDTKSVKSVIILCADN